MIDARNGQPELSLETPDRQEADAVLSEIATLLETSVSSLESKPSDVRQMLRELYLHSSNDAASMKASLRNLLDVHNSAGAAEPKQDNPMKSTEEQMEQMEQNANSIDGIINNLPPEGTKQQGIFYLSNEQRHELARAMNATRAPEQQPERALDGNTTN